MQPQCSRFSSLLCALHTSFVPAFKLTFFFFTASLLTPSYFFWLPLAERRAGWQGHKLASSLHLARTYTAVTGKFRLLSPARWPHDLTDWFLSNCRCHSPQTAGRPSTAGCPGRARPPRLPVLGCALLPARGLLPRLRQPRSPQDRALGLLQLPQGAEGPASTLGNRHLERSNKDKETTLAPQKHIPEA